MIYVPVNNYWVMSEGFPVFLGWASTKQQLKYIAQGHSTVTHFSLKLATLWSLVWQPSDPQSSNPLIPSLATLWTPV